MHMTAGGGSKAEGVRWFAQSFSRSIVFLLDRSGSMTGKPLQYARQALDRALTDLGPSDQLNIIAYDHEQVPTQRTPRHARPTCVPLSQDLTIVCSRTP
jgi:hypothetical protein